jgi:hypothetical protein
VDSSQLEGLEWRRSSRCNGGACVEVALTGDGIRVRRAGGPDDVVLAIPAGEWQEFIADVRAGRFDLE